MKGHSKPHMQLLRRAADSAACTSLYQQPSASQQLTAYDPFAITWDPNCIVDDAKQIDIYLYNTAGTGSGPAHKFQGVDASSGTFDTGGFLPQWWNATASSTATLKLQFANSGEPGWAASYVLGPAFNIAWNGTVIQSDNQEPAFGADELKDPAAGKLVAAILIPVLVSLLAIGGYVYWTRRKQQKKSKRWSQSMDRRMSQISTTWSAGQGRPVSMAAASRPVSMAAASRPVSVAAASQHSHQPPAHARTVSNYSFQGPTAALGSADPNRHSTISFAPSLSLTHSRGTSGSRPVSYPRVGQNGHHGDALEPLSPEQDSPSLLGGPRFRSHAQQKSLASSLRNEVSAYDEEHLQAAVSVINGESSLESLQDGGRPHSTVSYNTAPSSRASGTSLTLGATGHSRDISEAASLKMPRLARNSLSPDNALAAYASGHGTLRPQARSPAPSSPRPLSSNNPYAKRLSTNSVLVASPSEGDLPVAFGVAS